LSVSGLIKILNETDYDLLHFNSFFSFRFTIVPLLLRKFKLIPKKPYIICPRGNLSPAALNLKSLKKKIYIKLFKWLKLFKNLNWQASSEHEKKDIINIFGNKVVKIFVVPDFAPLSLKSGNNNYIKSRMTGALRLLFLSRISPMKNLDFFLSVLSKVKVYVELSIYGPKEDLKYWKKCLNLIDKLPSNIKVTINDEVPLNQVANIFDRHDLFISPTMGEAFGNAIIESLSAGLPALISDKTLWKPDKKGGLQVLTLNETPWVKTITNWSKFSSYKLKKKRQAASNYALAYYKKSFALKKNKQLIYSVL
jgi:glycosyltransferase involved in cell wall biosynthesis